MARKRYVVLDGPRTTLGHRLSKTIYFANFVYVPVSYKKFSDGTDDITISGFVAGRDVVFCMSMMDNNSIIQCLHVLTALLESFITSLTIVCPFVSCTTMERVQTKGDFLTFSGLSSCEPPTRFLCYDLGLHTYGHTLVHRFSADLKSIIRTTMQYIVSGFNLAVFPDEDAKKRYGPALEGLIQVGYCKKVRKGEERIFKVEEGLEVTGKDVIIVDDLVRTGETLKQCAAALKAQGASNVTAFCVHAAGSLEELLNLREPSENRALDSVILSNTCDERIKELATAATLDSSLMTFFDIAVIDYAVAVDITRRRQKHQSDVQVVSIMDYGRYNNKFETETEEREKQKKESLRVVVASSSTVKLIAVRRALCVMDLETSGFIGATITCPVPSGVSEQPMSTEETRQGCLNRLLAAKKAFNPETDRFIVSIENGLDEYGHDFAWVMVWDSVFNQTVQARSASVPVPYQVLKSFKRSKNAKTYSHVMTRVARKSNPHLELCGVDRSTILQQAVEIALGQLACLQ